MDMKQMGDFLKQLRNEKNLTQEQLGEQIGVTNKTISRWETGKYMIPVEYLETLSKLFCVTINELVSGKRLNTETYIGSAEENLKTTLGNVEKENKRFEKMMSVIFIITSILACIAILLLPIEKSMLFSEKIKLLIVTVIIAIIASLSNTVVMVSILLKKSIFGLQK
ncbi:MAG: helix-turn-helix domain-containing protein [Faecalimonas sp.]|nr:helix-turn-helix domain-containing protein [Faecalimonas sp.]